MVGPARREEMAATTATISGRIIADTRLVTSVAIRLVTSVAIRLVASVATRLVASVAGRSVGTSAIGGAITRLSVVDHWPPTQAFQ